MSDLKPLLYWIKEREAIRKKKAAGKSPPWTTDWILQTFRFCNVRRRDDRVSQWLIKHGLLNNLPWPEWSQYIAWVALCRYINWPPTIQGLMRQSLDIRPLDWKAIGAFLDVRQRRGEKTWTGAYMVKGKPQGKGKFIARTLGKNFKKFGQDVANTIHRTNSCKETYLALRKMDECGPFMAGQIVADLSYSPLLCNAVDLMTWAPLGPGSRRGYNRLLKIKPLKKPPNEEVFVKQLIQWRAEVVKKLGKNYKDMTLHDFQNCLCEFDKYERVRLGEGRPRSRYIPEWRF